MIRLTIIGRIIYTMLGQVVALLILYAMLFLLLSLQSLPINTLAHNISPAFISNLTSSILDMTILTGFMVGGLMMMSTESRNRRYVLGWHRAWTILLVAVVLLSGLAPLLIEILTAVLLLMFLGLHLSTSGVSPYLQVWRVGLVMIIGSIVGGMIATDVWQVVLDDFKLYLAYMVTGVSILFWLMTRWSNVRADWTGDGVKIVAGLMTGAGFLISIASSGISPLLGIVAVMVVPIATMILAGHSYRALKDQTYNASLSAHWIAIAVLLLTAGVGFLGTITTQGAIPQWVRGTQLAQAQHWVVSWGLLAIVLSLVNYTASELRGENRRVTGYMPLWLVGFGVALSAMVQVCMGLVEIYLARFLSADSATIQGLLLPLSIIWIICLLAVVLGIAIYALGFWVRRPVIVVSQVTKNTI